MFSPTTEVESSRCTTYVGQPPESIITFENLSRDYHGLLKQLYGDPKISCERMDFRALLEAKFGSFLGCAVCDRRLVGTAQISVIRSPAEYQVFITNIVMKNDYDGLSPMANLLRKLEEHARGQWLSRQKKARAYVLGTPNSIPEYVWRELGFAVKQLYWEKDL